MRQSPIDIAATAPKDLPNITFNYQTVPIEIINNGHTVQVNYPSGSFIELDGERFDLVQFHFHSPSEHRMRGRSADAEMHLVHKSASGGLAVVGVMIEEGPHNPGFDPVWNNLPASPGPAQRVNASIDADDLLPADPRTIRYDGSLTTPPGTEGVRWNLMVQPVTLSAEQLAKFRRIISGNNRPIQPLNGRAIIQDSSR
jgi:carbonic anhydrase